MESKHYASHTKMAESSSDKTVVLIFEFYMSFNPWILVKNAYKHRSTKKYQMYKRNEVF